MGVRLFRHYTPSGRALTAALGRVGHRARRKSCLGAGRLGQPSLRSQLPPISFHGSSVHISQPLVRMIVMERAGVVGQVGVSLLPERVMPGRGAALKPQSRTDHPICTAPERRERDAAPAAGADRHGSGW